MAMASGSGRGTVKSEINITPLVDVVLVLLIIFMVVTPLFQRGRDVQLPQASEQRKGAPENPIVVSLTSEGKLFLEREPFDEDGLRAALRARLRPEPWKQVLLKADRHLQFAEVRRVLGVLQQAGATGVRLAVQERAR